MEIKGQIHLLFEQSGTFKRAFQELGYTAHDYDICNEYGVTDFTIDLFHQIELWWNGAPSIFDNITKDDLSIAFFPCVYFNQSNMNLFTGLAIQYKGKNRREVNECIIKREGMRAYYYKQLLKLCTLYEDNELRMIVENPYTQPHYLRNNFPYTPALIDHNRQRRGDYYKKPTQYFYINCQPTYGESFQPPKEIRKVESAGGHVGSKCDRERSEISYDYARNFICDFILGTKKSNSLKTLF